MFEFFQEGGFSMYPVLITGLVLLGSAAFYVVDREPVRLRFISVLSLALLTFSVQGLVIDIATVFFAISDGKRFSGADRVTILLEGMKESTRPLTLGLGILGIVLTLAAIGIYRSGRRELHAAGR